MKFVAKTVLVFFLVSCAMHDSMNLDNEKTNFVFSFSEKFTGFENNNTYQWLGIPYAQAPVRSLRWKAPRPLQDQEKKIKALKFGNPCPQTESVSIDKKGNGLYVGSEDCLFLNVFTPKNINQEKNLPVMFWIHGGGNTSGESGSYDFSKLATAHNLVIVTINYRLGFLGWFYHPSFAATSNSLEDRSGNFGTLDQIMALKWVQQNIEDFGGDKNNVTIFGESAGGHNVFACLLYTSPSPRDS